MKFNYILAMSIDLLVNSLSKTRLETQFDLFAWYSWICREKEKVARRHYRQEIASFEAQHSKWHNTNRREWTQSSFPSKIFDVKFNSQATLRKAGSFTVHAQIIFFPDSNKKQELRFQGLCSPDIKIALKRNFIYIWSSPFLCRDRGFIDLIDRNKKQMST